MHGYLRHLANFAYVIEAGSISGAARRLDVSASAISDSVRILEAHLGTQLVLRRPGGIVPTSYGSTVYAEASQIVEALSRALREPQDQQVEGALFLSLPQEISDNGFHKVMTRMRELHPSLRLTLMIEDGIVDAAKHARDLFFRVGLGGLTPGLVPLWQRSVCLVTVAAPRLIQGIDVDDCEQVATLPYLCDPNAQGDYNLTLSSPDAALRFENTVQVSSLQSRLALARQGVGVVSCLGCSVAQDLESGALVRLLPERIARRGMMSLLSVREKTSPRETALVGVLEEVFGARDGELGE